MQRLKNIQSGFSGPACWSLLRIAPLRFVAASLVLAVIVGGLFWWSPWKQQTNLASLASEIAYHHNKQMVMEIESPSTSAVRTYLSKLDFPLIESERFPSTDWELVGGRYCSLKGHIAAQLRMRNKNTGKNVTFYQLLVPKEMADIEGTSEVFEQGVKVELWKERGLLLGTAQDQ